MKKSLIFKMLFILLAFIIVSGTSVFAANIYNANQIGYGSSNVETALNNLITQVNNRNYSTDEQIIGKWIDGKPIYRKTFNFENISAGSTKKISISDIYTTIDQIITINGIAYCSEFQQWYNIPNTHTNMSSFYINSVIEGASQELTVRAGSGFTNGLSKVIIYIEYTKTTDMTNN